MFAFFLANQFDNNRQYIGICNALYCNDLFSTSSDSLNGYHQKNPVIVANLRASDVGR